VDVRGFDVSESQEKREPQLPDPAPATGMEPALSGADFSRSALEQVRDAFADVWANELSGWEIWSNEPYYAGVAKTLIHTAPALAQLVVDGRRSVADRVDAVRGLMMLGCPAGPAMPALLHAAVDGPIDVRAAAMRALHQQVYMSWRNLPLPEDAAAVAAEGMQDRSPVLRREAVLLLQHSNPTVPAADAALTLALQDVDVSVRLTAARIAPQFGRGDEGARALADLLPGKDSSEFGILLFTLQRMRADARSALPALLPHLKLPHAGARILVLETVAMIGSDTPTVPAIIAGMIQDPAASVRAVALDQLARLPGSDCLPAVVPALSDRGAAVRGKAVGWFRRRPDCVKRALGDLLTTFEDPNSTVRALTIQLFQANPVQATTMVPVLAARLSDEREMNRIAAANALAAYGPRASSAAPDLLKAVADRFASVRLAALQALKRIRPPAQVLEAALELARVDRNADVRAAAIQESD